MDRSTFVALLYHQVRVKSIGQIVTKVSQKERYQRIARLRSGPPFIVTRLPGLAALSKSTGRRSRDDSRGGDYLDCTIEEVRPSDTPRYSDDSHTLPGAPFNCDASTRALWHFDEAAGATTFYDGEDGAGSRCGTVEDTSVGTNGASTGP